MQVLHCDFMARILIISDLHANLEALEASLDAAPAHDKVWNLGDVVGYGASPNEVIDISRRIGEIFVRGNHDKACSGVVEPHDFNAAAAMSAMWTRETLTPEHLAWVRDLPAGPIVCDGFPAQLSHGSPLDEDHYLIDIVDGCQTLAETMIELNLFGHTHIQGGFAVGDGKCFRINPDYDSDTGFEHWTLNMQPGAEYLINPGSIGQPRDGDPRAAFSLWDSNAHTMTYYRVPYDVHGAQERIRQAGLPEWLASRLMLGR